MRRAISKRILFALLLCFVALVGAVGAYAYMLNNQKSESSRIAVSNGYVLEIDKTVYERGENVTITFTNNSTETVGLSSPWPFIISDLEGNAVAPGIVAAKAVYLSPGESLTRIWNQRDYWSDPVLMPVPPGIYTVELYKLLAPLEADLSVTFEIVD